MKRTTISLTVLAAISLISCGGETTETNTESEKADSTETAVVEPVSTEEINTGEVNGNLEVALTETKLPGLKISIGLPAGWVAKDITEDPTMTTYAIMEGDTKMFYLMNSTCLVDQYDGEMPENTAEIKDTYDPEGTVFKLTENTKGAAGKRVIGVVYETADQEDETKYMEYFAEINGGDYVYAQTADYIDSVDKCIAAIKSIKSL